MNSLYIFSGKAIATRNGAAFIRMLNYAKAISNTGCKVYFCSPFLKKGEIAENEFDRINSNILFLGNIPNYSPIEYFVNLPSYFLFLYKHLKNNSDNKVVLTFPPNLHGDILLLIMCKLFLHVPIYLEKNELKIALTLNGVSNYYIWYKKIIIYPLVIIEAIKSFFHDLLIMFYDGVIAISNNMYKITRKLNKNVIKIPILVDCEYFQKSVVPNKYSDKLLIGFFGSLSEKKDGIMTLVGIIASLNKHNYNYELHLYGDISQIEYKVLNKLIREKKLEHRVFVNESLPYEVVPQEMKKHDLLIMLRPLNMQTKYGFSTKLAEYLATGIPVLITDVSDNSVYVKDGINGFLIKSFNNKEEIIRKLSDCLRNIKLFKNIGEEGQKTAKEHFDYINYSEQLIKFLGFEK